MSHDPPPPPPDAAPPPGPTRPRGVAGLAARLAAATVDHSAGVRERSRTIQRMLRLAAAGTRVALSAKRSGAALHDALETVEIATREGRDAAGEIVSRLRAALAALAAIHEVRMEAAGRFAAVDGAMTEVVATARAIRLLSFSASLEAARAGEEGTAFGVLAARMQELAATFERQTDAIGARVDAVRMTLRDVKDRSEEVTAMVAALPDAAVAVEAQLGTAVAGCGAVRGAESEIRHALGRIEAGAEELQATMGRLTGAGRTALEEAGEMADLAARVEAMVRPCAAVDAA